MIQTLGQDPPAPMQILRAALDIGADPQLTNKVPLHLQILVSSNVFEPILATSTAAV